MDTEKITFNMGIVELGKIDLLVEQGIFSDRSDFIRTAVRSQLSQYESDIREYIKPNIKEEKSKSKSLQHINTVGVVRLSKSELEYLRDSDGKVFIRVVGMLVVDNRVTPELFAQTVEGVKVYGAVISNDEIKKIIFKMDPDSEKKKLM